VKSIEDLERELTTPSRQLVEDVRRLDGDILVLGVGGKVGPTVATLAVNAIREARVDKAVYGVARFTDPSVADQLKEAGVVPVTADVTDDEQLAALPDAANVIYMIGHKFGTTGNEHLSWAMNAYLPGRVAEQFRGSRIVAFSTLCVYPLAPVTTGGSTEQDPPGPIGEYAASCVGRERMFEHVSLRRGTKVLLFRLGYAIETRYGVLLEIARAVKDGEPIDLSMGHASVIWQGDAAEAAIRSLHLADSPPRILNITGPEIVSIRWLAERFGERFGVEPVFTGSEEPTAYVMDGSAAHQAFGYPRVTLGQMIDWVGDWVVADSPTIDKPTRFQEREGRF
jgi:nucleoside-diphosphate-sugar epimerase